MDEPQTLAAASHATPNLSPVLGRYFERSWSHGEGHRLYDTAGKGYLDFANGIAVTTLGHHHPAVTAAIHAQADRLIGPTGAIGFTEPVSKLADDAGRHPADADRHDLLPELRLRGDRGRPQARPSGDGPARRSSRSRARSTAGPSARHP